MKAKLSWALALGATLAAAGNAQATTFSFGTWCTTGSLVACFAASVETVALANNAGTQVYIRIQNQEGWAGSTDNTGGSLISRVGIIAPDLTYKKDGQLDVYGEDDSDSATPSVTVGTDPGSYWKVVNAIGGTIEFGAGSTGAHGSIQGCNESNAGAVDPRFQTCNGNGWVVVSFQTTNVWTANSSTQLAVGWKSVDYNNQDYSFQCRMDGQTDGSSVLPCAPTSTVPEPVTMTLLGSGLAGLGFVRRRRRKENGDDGDR